MYFTLEFGSNFALTRKMLLRNLLFCCFKERLLFLSVCQWISFTLAAAEDKSVGTNQTLCRWKCSTLKACSIVWQYAIQGILKSAYEMFLVFCHNNLALQFPLSAEQLLFCYFSLSFNDLRTDFLNISSSFQTYQWLLEPLKEGCYGNGTIGKALQCSQRQRLSCCFNFCIECKFFVEIHTFFLSF